MAWVTATQVKAAINFPSTGAPLTDAQIEDFILDSQEEIEQLYNTRFGHVETNGTADGDYSTTTFSDSTQAWTESAYVGQVAWITGGTGIGQYREVSANDATKITVTPIFTTTPDATSTYKIVDLEYIDESVDGTGEKTQFTKHFPLINLNALTIDSTDITTTYVYQYKDAGELVLSSSAETRFFTDTYPQLIDLKYVFGVYPIPRIIQRLCILLAGMKTVAAKVSGSYSDFATVSLPGGISGSKGQPYVNLQAGIREMRLEVNNIIDKVYRPFTLFG